MIVEDVCKDGKWLRTVGTNPRYTTRAGAYYAEMLRRCNPSNQKGKYAAYAGCCSDFVDFQDFASWAVVQQGYGLQLDKDILIKGNKVYSKETCCFVPTEINNLLTNCRSKRGNHPVGVSYDSRAGYKVCVSDNGTKVYLGYFPTADEAFTVYKHKKECVVKIRASQFRYVLDPRAYEALMNYQVEITD